MMEAQTETLMQAIRDGKSVQNEQNEQPAKRKKPSKRLLATVAWLQENDPENKKTVREVAKGVNVSVGTVHNARVYIRENVVAND